MKIQINYDLIDKIVEAKGQYKLKRYARTTFKYMKSFLLRNIIGMCILTISGAQNMEQSIATTPIYVGTSCV